MSESREVLGLRAWLTVSGVPHRVTSTTGGGHAPTSYHYRAGTDGLGLALDAAGPVPSRDSAGLRAVYEALEPLGPMSVELIYSGPGGGFWKNGRRVSAYSASSHHDHVHIAVPKGWAWHQPTVNPPKEQPLPDDPNLPNITGPVTLHPIVDADGKCWGYYVFSSVTGELHTHGDPTKVIYHGRSEVV